MIRASALLALTTVLCLVTTPAFAQSGKDPKKKPAVAGPEKRAGGKADAKSSDKGKPEDKAATKAPETLEELRVFAASKLDATQKTALTKLKTDLETLESKAEVTPAMVADLKAALTSTLRGTLKPSETSALKLAGELATFVADGKVDATNLLKIQTDVQAVLFSPAVTEKQIDELKASVQSIAKSANLATPDTTSLLSSVESVAKNAVKDTPKPPVDPKKGGAKSSK